MTIALAPGVTTGSTQITGATSPYTHTGPTADIEYYYRVSAVNSGSEGALSNEAFDPLISPANPAVFPGANLRVCLNVRYTANTYASEATGTLSCVGMTIADVTGMEHLTGLTVLDLYTNSIVDVSPLAGLTSLSELYLWNNSIVDVSPLAGLTSLTVLYLYTNSITTGVDTLVALVNIGGAGLLDLTGNQATMPCAQLITLHGTSPPGSFVLPTGEVSGTDCL